MFISAPTDHNETNPKMEKAENPCPAKIFGERKSSIVSDTLVSKLSNLFGPPEGIRTPDLQNRNLLRYPTAPRADIILLPMKYTMFAMKSQGKRVGFVGQDSVQTSFLF